MSALAEIGHGQSTSDTEWERIKDKYLQNPKTPNPHIDLDPALKELKQIRVPSGMKPEVLEEVIKDAKQVRQQALSNAKKSLEDAFAPKFHEMFNEKMKEEMSKNIVPQIPTSPKPDEEITGDDLEEVITEIENEISSSTDIDKTMPITISLDSKSTSYKETKKLMDNFKDKVAKYPKHISYEGSMVICVLLSLKQELSADQKTIANLNSLPSVDIETIKSVMPDWPRGPMFEVEFDDNKDFILSFDNGKPKISITLFNSVVHPRPEDLKDLGNGAVTIEKDGDKIAVGGKIVLDEKGIKRLIGLKPLKAGDVKYTEKDDDNNRSRRQPVSGRNAFEIREDILESAIDMIKFSNISNKRDIDELSDDVLRIASKFYEFVENKNRNKY